MLDYLVQPAFELFNFTHNESSSQEVCCSNLFAGDRCVFLAPIVNLPITLQITSIWGWITIGKTITTKTTTVRLRFAVPPTPLSCSKAYGAIRNAFAFCLKFSVLICGPGCSFATRWYNSLRVQYFQHAVLNCCLNMLIKLVV